jgi:purine-nucleoside/S-methyl-5'-thioadenosine phosphorylase / adenosine deaminase
MSVASSPIPRMFMTGPQPNRAFRWTQAPWGAALVCEPLADVAVHLFTVGNLQLRADPAEWAAVAAAMQVPKEALRLIRQVHGATVAAARRGESSNWNPPEADAVISDDPGAAIAVRVADCAPILIADRRLRVVGAVHAGWRGTMQSIAVAGVRALAKEFRCDPSDLVAAIGPCLGPCCGEVGPEVVEAFRNAGHGDARLQRWFSDGASGRYYLDLWTANRDQLIDAGVPEADVHVAGLCSKTHAGLMHSYRAAGQKAGRMVGIIKQSMP